MRFFFITLLILAQLHASLDTIESFEADFTQNVTDEKAKILSYHGFVTAAKPQHAIWKYTEPVIKNIYINKNQIVIVEPEIEQVILKKLDSNLDFFQIIGHAKKITQNRYRAVYKNVEYTIEVADNIIKSISYNDEFENKIQILFQNQKQNHIIDKTVFTPVIPVDFDIISE